MGRLAHETTPDAWTAMTEAEWLACSDPKAMLAFLRGQVSERKLRLFAAACCRTVWNLLPDKRCRLAVEVAERFADGLATPEELSAAHADCERAWQQCKRVNASGFLDVGYLAAQCAKNVAYDPQTVIKTKTVGRAAKGKEVEPILPRDVYPGYAADSAASARAAELGARQEAIVQKERTVQAQLLRDICGNLFKPHSRSARWSPAVLRHAKAQYSDNHSVTALGKALADAGRTELSEHFTEQPAHPKGCWVVDLILGKE
jgi:hypothetical protein